MINIEGGAAAGYRLPVPDAHAEEFVKRRTDAPADFFAWEAAGLRWLAEPQSGATVVDVHAVTTTSIALQRLRPARASAAGAERFGRQLAMTHDAGAPAFGVGPPGWTGDGYIGRQRLMMREFDRWGEFYASTRVLPYARAAVRVGTLNDRGLAAIERVCERLAAGDFDDGQPPARIHGDMWGGNVMYTEDGAVLIDPAAHGGHRLTDLAMLALFGTEHLDRVLTAYADTALLPAGWPDLIGLHQLHPVAVHAVSHGPSYGRQAAALAARYL